MKRRLAREIAVQTLYQMEMNDVSAEVAIKAAVEELIEPDETVEVSPEDDLAFLENLVKGTATRGADIDNLLADFLTGWKIDRLSKVDRQILRLAVFEMFYQDLTPGPVAVNEAIELAKHFGTDESGKFVNGVLGQMIKASDEIRAKIQQ
jgi:N utilization substance protein B